MRRKYYNLFAVAAVFLFLILGNNVRAESSSVDKQGISFKAVREKAEKGVKDPITGYRISWKEGLHLASPEENLMVKIGGKIILDGGNIDADDELQRAFPDLDGGEFDFRDLSVDIFGTVYDSVDFRFEIDFANVSDIKDIWFRISKNSYLKRFRFGHMKEPSSIEDQTGINSITFMERALPVQAFSKGRNIGIRYDHPLSDSAINWSAGMFLNSESFGTLGEGSNQLSDANGINLTARITGVPWYEKDGKKLMHLGLSYSHGFRDENDIILRARPESRITDDRLVDTGKFKLDGIDRIGTEVAVVSGPLSFQGEGFYTLIDSALKGDPEFWGAYAYLSYFVTGEHRKYSRSMGTFSFGEQYYQFRPREGGWGAWELGMRYSYVDLNDAGINGGKERNFTIGVNWYHQRNIRVMLNYIRVNVKDRASPSIENGRANIFQTRFQIIF